ncbi:MAG: tRNA 5-methoxyuridine(34)/uridine 5-oxyacetic acid(34) synthase CmoB, partial [Proteobacteria bacterium]|nr:tRNA 5-methoxyuridine(34)/uridine 5-oxyacetic acid(34) synthase CmoB [Pseudomonadota bacterium]
MTEKDDYLPLLPSARHGEILDLRKENLRKLNSRKKGFLAYRLPYESVCHLRASSLELAGDVVRIGSP